MGQIHHGSTYHVSSLFSKKLNGKITEIFLPKDFNDPCLGYENVSQKKKDKIEKDMSKLADKILKRSYHIKPSLKVRIFMPVMKIIVDKQKDSVEYKYWKEKGWFDGQTPWKE